MCVPAEGLSEIPDDRRGIFRLFGRLGTLAYDIRNNCWSKEILEAVKVPMDFFPKCYGTAEAAGTVCEAAFRETGLATTTVVSAGGGDQVMQGIGNGITEVGGASSNIGTSGQVSFQSDVPILNPALSTNTFCGYKKGRWITMGAIMNAGLSFKWFNSLFEKTDYNLINEQVAKVKPGSGGVVFLPYLNGERTPHVNPNLSGMFLGVNLNTGRAEMSRAVMEGVAFALNQCIEVCGNLGLRAKSMIASGGGARSAPGCRFRLTFSEYRLRWRTQRSRQGLDLPLQPVSAPVSTGISRRAVRPL
ncbi:MAG: FGGY-family carbohydrate kinase [Lachnospiraceae bacterium]